MNDQIEPRPDHKAAWHELHDKLAWIQFHPLLTRYLGMNFADIANALIDEAYPGLRDRTATTLETLWPDIGTDTLKGGRPADRYEASAIAVRAAYVRQQQGVPPQTALVWRWHLGALLEEHTRLNAILSRPKDESVQMADARRTIEILSRALAWLGDPVRMATTREEWQQTIDAAIAWVKANPEDGRPSFSSFSTFTATAAHGKALFDHEMRERGLTADWKDVDPDEQLGWIASAQAVFAARDA